MNPRDFLFVVAAIIALLAGGYYLYTQQPAQQAILFPSLEWNVLSTADVGDELIVRLLVSHFDQKTVFLEVDGNRFTRACLSDPCALEFPLLFMKPGLYSIKARLGKYDSSRTISIHDTQTRCIDGTLESACGASPLQCLNGSLVPRCSVCGCPNEMVCENDGCVTPTLRIAILQLAVQQPTPSTVHATFTLRNDSSVRVDGLFLLQLEIFDNAEQLLLSTPQQIRLDALVPGAMQMVQVDSIVPSRSARVGGKIFSMTVSGDRGDLIGTTLTTQPLVISSDATPPLSPSNVRHSTLNELTLLEWNASVSTDVTGYLIYRQNFDSQQFTTYSLLAEVAGSPYVIPPSATPLLYIIRAKDVAGNLSEPTTAISLSSGNST